MCSVESCTKDVYVRGFCNAHYLRNRRHGSPLGGGSSRRYHGYSRTPEYRAWKAFVSRCTDPKDSMWKHYGGRGITVCDRWRYSIENFVEDMGYRPSDKHSIDRVDNDGNYEPSNCRWTTIDVQLQNRRPLGLFKNNTSGYVGVNRADNRWEASVTINYKKVSLGRYATKAEAITARRTHDGDSRGLHI